MGNILLLVLCLAGGVVLRATGRLPQGGHAALNGVIINVALPALTLIQLQLLRLDSTLLLPVALPWLMFLAALAFFHVVGRRLGLDPTTSGALILCGGLANTSFVGLPMILAFYRRRRASDRDAHGSVRQLPGAEHARSGRGVAPYAP